jgi:hypothetical protein
MLLRQFELWPLGDSDARGFLSSRTYLRGHRLQGEQTTGRSYCGEFWKQFIHIDLTNEIKELNAKKGMGAASDPHAVWPKE